jgi:hypothetical protein
MNWLNKLIHNVSSLFKRVPPDVEARYTVRCEAMFEDLADENPARLVELLSDPTMDGADLTFAAEIAGRMIRNSKLVVPPLLGLLRDSRPLAREGAVMGLGFHVDFPGVKTALELVAETDPSEGVATAAQDMLEDFADWF